MTDIDRRRHAALRGKRRPIIGRGLAASLQVEGAGGVVPKDLSFDLVAQGLLVKGFETRRKGAVRMGVVRVEAEVPVADEFNRGGEGALIAAGRDPDLTLEVLRRRFRHLGMFGVPRKLPMLLHSLKPIGHPTGVCLDMYHTKLGELLQGSKTK